VKMRGNTGRAKGAGMLSGANAGSSCQHKPQPQQKGTDVPKLGELNFLCTRFESFDFVVALPSSLCLQHLSSSLLVFVSAFSSCPPPRTLLCCYFNERISLLSSVDIELYATRETSYSALIFTITPCTCEGARSRKCPLG
jgi:hypothetical protein